MCSLGSNENLWFVGHPCHPVQFSLFHLLYYIINFLVHTVSLQLVNSTGLSMWPPFPVWNWTNVIVHMLLQSSSSAVGTHTRPLATSLWSHSYTSGILACDLDHEVQIDCVLYCKLLPSCALHALWFAWVIADEAARRGHLAVPLSFSRTESRALSAILFFPWLYITDPEVHFSVDSHVQPHISQTHCTTWLEVIFCVFFQP